MVIAFVIHMPRRTIALIPLTVVSTQQHDRKVGLLSPRKMGYAFPRPPRPMHRPFLILPWKEVPRCKVLGLGLVLLFVIPCSTLNIPAVQPSVKFVVVVHSQESTDRKCFQAEYETQTQRCDNATPMICTKFLTSPGGCLLLPFLYVKGLGI
jgi:hypothetical protein